MEEIDSNHLYASKENIQPLRQGRDTSKLCVALQAQTNSELQQTLEKQRNEFEIRLRSKNSDDPLSDWCDYIHWIEQSFPKQPREGKLHVILKKCLTKFKESERYKNDVRFVKICIKYAEIEGSTVELLSQIHCHGIGVHCAELYVAWAEKYVVNNCFKKANLIYEKGIANHAQPIELLIEAHKNFHAFLGRRILNSDEEFKPTFLEPLVQETRQAYNVLRPVATGQTEVVSNVRVGANVKGSPGKLQMELPKEKKLKSNIGIKIFEDNENEPVLPEPVARLEKIPNKKKSTKENTVKPGPWSEKPKKKVPFTVAPTSVPFEVHRDEEDAKAIHRPQAVPSSVLKSHSKKDYDEAKLADIPLFYPEPEDESKVAMYCKDQVYAGGLEFQFEELRAIDYNKKIEERERMKVEPRITDFAEACDQIVDKINENEIQSDSHADSVDCHELVKKGVDNDDELIAEVNHKNKAQRRKSLLCVPKPLHQKLKNKCLSEDIPTTDHSMNQTIHTKEALSEMQQLWFSKPASPLLNDPPPSKQAGKSILKTVKPCFNLYIDESCIDNFKSGEDQAGALDLTLKSSAKSDAPKLVNSETKASNCVQELDLNAGSVHKDNDPVPNYERQDMESDNKENFVPNDYLGQVGKSTRKVTGILTPAENVPVDPIGEIESEDEDEELEDGYYNYVALCNTTAVTENLTKAFQLPRNESTPNMRKSFHNKKDINRSLFDHEGSYDEPKNRCGVNEPSKQQEKPDVVVTDVIEIKRSSPQIEAKCVDNLSVIVETSREYKSTSSGSSGISTLQTKSFKNFPNTPMDMKGASSTISSRSGFHKTKVLSLTGYEASTESIAFKSRISMSDKLCTTKDFCDVKGLQTCLASVEEEIDTSKERFSSISKSNVIDLPSGDIDPFSDHIIDMCLKSVGFPSEKSTQNLINEDSVLNLPKVGSSITLGNFAYDVKAVLGEGSYARVFDLVNKSTGKRIIAKIQEPAFPWEYYIVEEVHKRMSNSEMVQNFMKIETAYLFRNASVFLTKPVEYGTLLDTVNTLKQHPQISHMIAVYFTVEILRILDKLHSCKIIHADIKPDNFLVMKRNEKPSLRLIDFGRSIDMTLFPEGTTFTRVITTEGFTTTEMKMGKPWTYQVDFFGAANCSHCLLFGEYMNVLEKDGVWNITKIVPRYWARTEWKNYFFTLLNIESCQEIPKVSSLVDPFVAILTDNKELDFILNRLNTVLKNR